MYNTEPNTLTLWIIDNQFLLQSTNGYILVIRELKETYNWPTAYNI